MKTCEPCKMFLLTESDVCLICGGPLVNHDEVVIDDPSVDEMLSLAQDLEKIVVREEQRK